MPNANYRRGAAFEYEIAEYYRSQGYTVVRSAGSKGAVDLVCFNGEQFVLVQCKKETKKKHSYRDDVLRLRELDVPSNSVRVLCIKRAKRGVIEIHNIELDVSTETSVSMLRGMRNGD